MVDRVFFRMSISIKKDINVGIKDVIEGLEELFVRVDFFLVFFF